MAKADIINADGTKAGQIELPAQFAEEFRPDVIQRAFLAIQSNSRQAYGNDPLAGQRSSAEYRGERGVYGAWANRGMHRTARIRIRAGHMTGRARVNPQATKGRAAHGPQIERNWSQKINAKENRLAIRSAIAATANVDLVKARNHQVEKIKLPLIIDNTAAKKTKEVVKTLHTLGLGAEMERTAETKIRAGKGKARGRRYKVKVGPLVVVNDTKDARAFANIQGVEVVSVKRLNVKSLAPGSHAGRLTIWTKGAVETLAKDKLYM